VTDTVTVVTPALPTRPDLLAQNVASVAAQTVAPLEHLIHVDHARQGTGRVKNELCRAAGGRWIATLEDDDLALPNHLETLLANSDGADIVYSWCEVVGRSNFNPNRGFDPDELRRGNFIPATALIRHGLVDRLGGWRDSADCPNGWEDWDFWLRALDAGARFRCVETVTWRYVFHGGNKTLHGEAEAF
jgi:glycosyltransferase involved in cell wall biosynthesis